MNVHLNVHHIRYAVKNVEAFVKILKNQLHFVNYAFPIDRKQRRSTAVMKHQDVIFIIDERIEEKDCSSSTGFCFGNNIYPVDTVCDVCLSCPDIERTLKRITAVDLDYVTTNTSNIYDDKGSVKFAVVKPPSGNYQHTLVDLSAYSGSFLPGFEIIRENSALITQTQSECNLIQAIDHIALVFNIGHSDRIMQWYNECLGFCRLMINLDEDEDEGFLVQEGKQGLRLKAMFGPVQNFSCGGIHDKFQPEVAKFVFCEALGDSDVNQVSHFMRMHRGAGVQHIAFSTKDIINTISQFKKHGLDCIPPPESYYKEVLKLDDLKLLNFEVDTLKDNHILIESHLPVCDSFSTDSSSMSISLNAEDQLKKMGNTQWFIMQVFTSTVFEEKTLFFEIIQRFQTMSGFGAGNIGALWRAVQKNLFK